jgi:hypothetical protein
MAVDQAYDSARSNEAKQHEKVEIRHAKPLGFAMVKWKLPLSRLY